MTYSLKSDITSSSGKLYVLSHSMGELQIRKHCAASIVRKQWPLVDEIEINYRHWNKFNLGEVFPIHFVLYINEFGDVVAISTNFMSTFTTSINLDEPTLVQRKSKEFYNEDIRVL